MLIGYNIIIVFHLGIIVEAYSPLGSPARPGAKDDEPVVMNDPVIKDIAVKRKVSPAQVYFV